MDVGSLASSLLSNNSGIGSSGSGNSSYYRTVSFDLSGLGLGNDVDAHWTMSCGNDAIDGGFHYDVPEPATLSLMGLGLIGLGFMRRRKAKI